RPELIEDLQRLPLEHDDVRVTEVGDIKELLLRVGGEADAGRRAVRGAAAVDEDLRDVLAVWREPLHTPVGAIGDVDEPVVRNLDRVYRVAELGRTGAGSVQERG